MEIIMKIAILGATGNLGTYYVDEALRRGHNVTAISRHASKLPKHDNLTIVELDVNDVNALAKALEGQDAVLSALAYDSADGRKMLDAAKKAGVKHLVVSGSFASFEYEPGKLILDHPDFPKEYYPMAERGVNFYNVISQEKDLNWSYIAPSMEFLAEGPRGNYKIERAPIYDQNGKSSISFGDLAVALMNEVENPAYRHERVTIGY
jgi:putative NADH-flavin reductase